MKNTFLAIILLIAVQIKVQSQLYTIDRFGSTSQRNKNAKENHIESDSVKSAINITSSVPPGLKFGKQNREITSTKKFYPPLKQIVPTSKFGWRKHPVTGEMKFHTGIDLKAFYEPVYCIADGIVSFSGQGEIEGNYVIIDHGQVSSVYCHLSKIFFSAGQVIKAGKVLGISGNTGRSTGPHLHFEVKWKYKKINPENLLSFIRSLGTKIN